MNGLLPIERRGFANEIAKVERLMRSRQPAVDLLRAIDHWQQEAHGWSTSIEALTKTLESATPVETQALLASWLRRFAPKTRLAGDLASLSRDFGLDAARERSIAHRDHLGACTEFACVGLMDALVKDEERRPAAGARLRRILRTHERRNTRLRAARCLLQLIEIDETASYVESIGSELLQTALGDGDVWTRRAAAGVVPLFSEEERIATMDALRAHATNDAALVRARVVEGFADNGLWDEVRAAFNDPSEVVRFQAVRSSVGLHKPSVWRDLYEHSDSRTRCVMAEMLGLRSRRPEALDALVKDASHEVSRFALDGVLRHVRRAELPPELVETVRLHPFPDRLRNRRLAERIMAWQAHHQSPAKELAVSLSGLEEGGSQTVRLPLNVQPLDLATAIRPYALEGFGFTLRPKKRRVVVYRGDHLATAGWRVLHEIRNPAPAKRQGHDHGVGPQLNGPIQVPPLGLAEQSATGVPGQRVQVAEEDWGQHVPSLDDYRRALRFGTAWVVSGSGTTTVYAPERMVERWRARWSLLWNYESLHQERMAAIEQSKEERFLTKLEDAGFRHEVAAVGGFLPYLLSTGGNTLLHLAVLTGVMWLLLMGANIWMRTWILIHRGRLGLVVGGWGTRGKSGTERIKAGFLKGAGVPFVSKTTGCEAMILHGPRGDRVRELFLFRPFDKATIWEQADVLRFASVSGASAMIWECMALNPRYVDILQRGWMRDDIGTLTNAYPDHEDVMGPSGMDVAQAIGSFSPAGSPVYTAEDNMLPTLKAQAARFGSTCTPLSMADKELIERELLVRFPYAEHPSNIALAARVATELGVHRVEAIGWMADHVIPDLGALMVCPPVDVDGREVHFVNGHSANDELSFTHSWTSTGFADHRMADQPDTWLVGVINNRADRVPRSRVFARMAVRVAGAHRFLVIGTNLTGFTQFVDEALDELILGLDLSEDEAWERWTEFAKICDPSLWVRRLATLRGYAPTVLDETLSSLKPAESVQAADDITRSLSFGVLEDEREFLEPEIAIWSAHQGAHTDTSRKEVLRARLRRRVLLLHDAGASGDQVASAAASLVPAGFSIKMIGMQNIKGTGLDFCYQWVRWKPLSQHLASLDEDDIANFSVKQLTSVFHCDATLKALAGRNDGAELAALVQARRAELLALRMAKPEGSAAGRWVRYWAWRCVDPFDAVWRRRRSRRILADLSMARIGHDDAVTQLAELTKRQKG